MADETQQTNQEQDVQERTEEALTPIDRLRHLYEENIQTVNYAFGAVALVIVGVVVYNSVWMPRRNAEAQEQLLAAQYYFERDSFQMVLTSGVEDVASSYGRTAAGNLARYYAGVSHYHLGAYDAAIDHLSTFKTDDPVIEPVALGVLGDAYAESGDMDKAMSQYMKAVCASDNDASTPVLLLKAGMAHESQGDLSGALELYERIRDDYPDSPQAFEVAKYVARVEAQL